MLVQEHLRRPWGDVGHRYSEHILELYHQYSCAHILDYGCGQALLSKKIGDLVPVDNYDPGIPAYSTLPQPRDLVVCVDVLEHIEPQCIHSVLAHLQSLTLKVAYVNISSVPARSSFPNGQNLHLIQEPLEWWLSQLSQYFTLGSVTNNLVICHSTHS